MLAKEIISAIHSEEKYSKVKRASEILYKKNYSNLNSEDITMIFQDAIKYEITRESLDKNLLELLAELKVSNDHPDKLFAVTQLFKSNALKINGNPVTDSLSKLKDFTSIVTFI